MEPVEPVQTAWSFPDRVAQGGDGAYYWTYDMKAQGNSAPFWTMVFIGAAVFVPVALIMLFLTWQYGALQAALACLSLLAIGVALPALIWKLQPPSLKYRMTEAEIQSWPKGRGNNIHHFEGVRRVTLRPDIDRVQLRWAVFGLHVYVPREDYSGVVEYILAHVPQGAEVVHG